MGSEARQNGALAIGISQVCQRGSPVVMQNRTASTTITVPVPDHPEIRLGTLMSIIKQSGLPKDIFES
jgi:predicted RNA binding protein YcfA (HicA-like mRNA interferase family)